MAAHSFGICFGVLIVLGTLMVEGKWQTLGLFSLTFFIYQNYHQPFVCMH